MKKETQNTPVRNAIELTRNQNFIDGKIDAFDLLVSCTRYKKIDAPKRIKDQPLTRGR